MAAVMAFSAVGAGSVFAEVVDDGFITDSNGIMAYKFLDDSTSGNTIELRGFYSGEWKRTSYSDHGISTYIVHGSRDDDYYASLRVGSFSGAPNNVEGFVKVPTTGAFEDAGDGISVKVDPVFVNNGKQIQLNYIVKNNGNTEKVFSLGAASDVEIGEGDRASIYRFPEGNGFMMVSNDDADKDPVTEEYAQLNFWGKSAPGVTDVTDFWFGRYGLRNGFNKDEGNTELVGVDSGMSYSWKNKVIAPNATQTYSVLFGVGGLGSEVIPPAVEKHTITVNYSAGGRAYSSVVEAEQGERVSVFASPDEGYKFGSWEIVRGGITLNANTFIMPDCDVEIFANFVVGDPEKYRVYVTASEGGNASSSVIEAYAGQLVEISANANSDYKFDKWEVLFGDIVISSNSFVMPESNVRVKANFVKKETEIAYKPIYYTGLPHSYIYSYDSAMNKIAINSNKKFITGDTNVSITVKLGADYAGKNVVLYNGKKSTSVMVDEAVLDSRGYATFSVPMGKNFTLVVE